MSHIFRYGYNLDVNTRITHPAIPVMPSEYQGDLSPSWSWLCMALLIYVIYQGQCLGFHYPSVLGETEEYQDQSKDILNPILNEDVLSDGDSEEPIEES